MFLLAHDEHRTRRGADHALGGAADAEMFPAGETVRRDHDQVGVEFLGGFDDFVRWESGADG